jgi:alkylation response protein AidB-like acyl-CoA dehydrogenase
MLTSTAVLSRASALDDALGDPADPENPAGFAGLLDAGERGVFPAAAAAILDDFGVNAEFVPQSLGGRLRSIDELARTLRPVFRRDVTLGVGYGVSSFIAAANVWTAGSSGQQHALAATLLANEKASVCYHELAHGNDFARNEFRADPAGPMLVLNGEKHSVNNVGQAAALVLFARTGTSAGSRSHSVLLLDRDMLDARHVEHLARYRTPGVTGCQIGGIRFTDCPVPATTVVGAAGDGVEIALRSFQITRSALPAMAVAALDTALRTTLGFAFGRRLYGTTVAGLPHARATLTAVFADLLTCDALATVASRALHLLPGEASVLASASKYLVPKLLREAAHDLSVVLGARSYLREGEHAIFEKILRDMPVLSLSHAGGAVCQASILAQLPTLARHAWTGEAVPPPQLFQPGADLPPLRPELLQLTNKGHDSLVPSLEPACAELLAAEGRQLASDVACTLRRHLRALREDSAQLAPIDRTAVAAARGFGLAHRYALLAAASACLGIWRAHRGDASHFLANPSWLLAALTRIAGRLNGTELLPPADLRERMFAELSARYNASRSFDLDAMPLRLTVRHHQPSHPNRRTT